MEEPHLPDLVYYMDKDEDPGPCFVMTNPYEAILTHDPTRSCVQVTPDMLHSFQPPEDKLPTEDPGSDIWYLSSSGKIHFRQIGLWSIMSDKPSYTVHPTTLWSKWNRLYGFLH